MKTINLPPVPPTTWQDFAKVFEATLDRREALILRGIELSQQSDYYHLNKS